MGISPFEVVVLVLFTPPGWILLLAIAGLALASVLGVERTGLHRGALVARWAGFAVGGAGAIALIALSANGTWPTGRLGLGALAVLAPLLGAAALILAIVIGELTMPAAGGRRVGSLVPRGPRTVIPVPALVLALTSVVALVALCVATTLTASPDDQGRVGRSVTWTARGGEASGSAGPYPGQWYTLPLLVGGAALALLCVAALVIVLRRRPADETTDLLLRRRSATSVLGALAIATGTLDVAFAVLAGSALHSLARSVRDAGADDPLGTAARTVQVLCWIAGPLGGVSMIAGLVMVCFPAALVRRTPRRTPARSARDGARG